MSDARPAVAVLGVDSPIGLTVIRELGERGVPVLALGRAAHALGRYSRYATRYFQMDEGPLAQWLPAFVEANRPAAILAISEGHLLQLAPLKGTLGDCKILTPGAAELDLVLDKQRTLEIAHEIGLRVPISWQPRGEEDFALRAAELDYPVVLKWPNVHDVTDLLAANGLEWLKAEYASGPADLVARLERYRPIGTWPLVQSWCPGEGFGQMLHMHRGSSTLHFQHRRLRECPPSGGVSSFCEAVPLHRHRDQMALSEKLLEAIGWEGPAMVEYRHDPETGHYWLMEVNGRFWGSLPLAYHCGAHFAWELYRREVVEDSAPSPAWVKLRKARFVIPDVKHLAAILRDDSRSAMKKAGATLRFLADFVDPRVRYYVWSLKDPGPLIGDVRAVLRRIVR